MTLQHIRISTKLPVFAILTILLTGSIISALLLWEARVGFLEMAEKKLKALSVARQSELSNYLNIIDADLDIQAQNPTTMAAARQFTTAWNDISGDKQKTLQDAYITNNPNPTGEKHKLDIGNSGSMYDDIHLRNHGYFRTLLEKRGYYDIFITDTAGNVIYSVYKELDFATSLTKGQWAGTDLAKVFKTIAASPDSTRTIFTDFNPYAPSADAPASFLGRSIIDRTGKFIGTLIYQMPVGEINRIMQASVGMGESGETYIVGADMLMRSDSRFSKESTILKNTVDNQNVKAALAGQSGVNEIFDYRGVEVISAYAPIEFHGEKWAILAEIDEAEAMQTAASIRNISIMLVIAISAVGAILALLFAKSITKPITEIVRVMNELAKGNNKINTPYVGRGDEVGDMAEAVEVFKQNSIERERLEAEDAARVEEQLNRTKQTEALTKEFDQVVTNMLGKVGQSVQEMHVAADGLSANAEQTQQQSANVSVATEQASANVQTVSAASTELNASIEEIARQVHESQSYLVQAVDQAEAANAKISNLANSAAQIGEVISMINDIADQTNLLALNATIESARAGAAGKGFAVVASEVKNLASQTGRATSEIGAQIKAVQAETQEAVDAIRTITKVINHIHEMETAIAGAVEEQNASTSEIARNVEEAARGTQDVSDNITDVASAANDTGKMAQIVYTSASGLLEDSETLRVHIEDFLTNVHAIQAGQPVANAAE